MTKKWIEIDVTLECNWKCPYCVRLCNLKQNNPSSIMNLDDIKKITDEIKEIGENNFEHITLIGGEPTLNPYIIDICKYLKNNLDIKLEISTNSTNNSKYKKIIEEIGIKVYTFAGNDNIKKKIKSHINFYVSPTENKQELRDDCGLNCGINISKINNKLTYSYCGNQKYLSILLQKDYLLKNNLHDIYYGDEKIDPLTLEICKHCQFKAKNRIHSSTEKISECFKIGIKKYEEN